MTPTHLLITQRLNVYQIHLIFIQSFRTSFINFPNKISFRCSKNILDFDPQLTEFETSIPEIVLVDKDLKLARCTLNDFDWNGKDFYTFSWGIMLFDVDKIKIFRAITKSNVDKKWKQLIVENM